MFAAHNDNIVQQTGDIINQQRPSSAPHKDPHQVDLLGSVWITSDLLFHLWMWTRGTDFMSLKWDQDDKISLVSRLCSVVSGIF